MKRNSSPSAAILILLAAARLAKMGKEEFTEWDLTVSAWQLDRNRFGCRGYEVDYPDHKRVMMEIMGTSKRDNPLAKGWMVRTRPNHYRITSLGLAHAERFSGPGDPQSARSNANLYDALAPYTFSKVFEDFRRKTTLPKMWLSVEAFYGITTTSAADVRSKLDALSSTIRLGKAAMDTANTRALTRGPVGGGRAITAEDIDSLEQLHYQLQITFRKQFDAILLGR